MQLKAGAYAKKRDLTAVGVDNTMPPISRACDRRCTSACAVARASVAVPYNVYLPNANVNMRRGHMLARARRSTLELMSSSSAGTTWATKDLPSASINAWHI